MSGEYCLTIANDIDIKDTHKITNQGLMSRGTTLLKTHKNGHWIQLGFI